MLSPMLATLLFFGAILAGLLIADARSRERGSRWLWLMPPLMVLGAAAMSPSWLVASKWVAKLIMPTGLVWSALVGLAGLALLKGRRADGKWLIGLWLAYSVAGSPWLGASLMHWLEQGYQEMPALSADEPLDAVLVLGGGTSRTPWREPQLGPTGDRVLRGARVYKKGLTRRLITSGISVGGLEEGGVDRDLMAETRLLWLDMGVPDEAIFRLERARNTKEEVAALATRMRAEGWRRVGLVTSAWHLRRAMMHVAREGIEVIPIPADIRGSFPPLQPATLIPNGFGFRTVMRACWEMLGALVGR